MIPPQAIAAIAEAGISALGSILGGNKANKQGKAIQAAKREEADQDRAEAGTAATLSLTEYKRLAGHAATVAAASGGGITGSALEVMDDLKRQAIFNAQSRTYEGLTQARAAIIEGNAARKAGHDAQVGGWVKAGGTFLGAAGAAAIKYGGSGKAPAKSGGSAKGIPPSLEGLI